MADATIQYIWDYIANISGNEYGTAGLLGNIKAESGIIPFRLQNDFTSGYTKSLAYTEKVDNGTYSREEFISDNKGYGLAQWTFSSRKASYYDWVKGRASSIGSAAMGVSFLVNELQTGYPSVWNAIVNATNIKSVSDLVLTQFEKPDDQSEKVKTYRASLGTAIYNEYAHGIPPTPPEPPEPEPPESDYSHLIPILLGCDEN